MRKLKKTQINDTTARCDAVAYVWYSFAAVDWLSNQQGSITLKTFFAIAFALVLTLPTLVEAGTSCTSRKSGSDQLLAQRRRLVPLHILLVRARPEDVLPITAVYQSLANLPGSARR